MKVFDTAEWVAETSYISNTEDGRYTRILWLLDNPENLKLLPQYRAVRDVLLSLEDRGEANALMIDTSVLCWS